jgi:hypothetical protein
MQQLFLVGGKLLGLYFVVGGLVQAIFLLTGGSHFPGTNTTLTATLLTQLLAGIALAFFTRPLLNLVGLRDLDQTVPRISPRSALEAGCILLGLIELVRYIPQFATLVEDYRVTGQISLFPRGVGEAVALAVSLALVFAARPIAGFIWAANNRRPRALDGAEQRSAP